MLLLLSRFSRVLLFATPRTAVYQASPSMGFSRQEYWRGLPLPSPSMIEQMLEIWSSVPLLFLNPACTSGSSRFMYCWGLAWKILTITLLACEMVQLCRSLNILWHALPSVTWGQNCPWLRTSGYRNSKTKRIAIRGSEQGFMKKVQFGLKWGRSRD